MLLKRLVEEALHLPTDRGQHLLLLGFILAERDYPDGEDRPFLEPGLELLNAASFDDWRRAQQSTVAFIQHSV